MPKKPLSDPIGVRLDEEDKGRVKRMAGKMKLAEADVLRMAVRSALARFEQGDFSGAIPSGGGR